MSATSYERGWAALKELRESAEHPSLDRNEAQTRFAVIDRVLLDVLGWRREELVVEERLERTFADYVLGQPERKLVVEAKREGVHFALPAGFEGGEIGLPALREHPATDKAIRQAVGYCVERGIMLGAVCNGHQFVGFLGSRQDGVPPLEGRAIVFVSLDDMDHRFREFWDFFSRPGVIAQYALRAFRRDSGAPPPEKLSARVLHYPGYKGRNEIQTDLKILGDVFIHGIIKDPSLEDDFLRECYYPSGSLSQYALVSREILQARYAASVGDNADVTAVPTRDKRGVAPELRADIVAASLSTRPLVLLGDVGAGKSTFIRHLIRVDARDLLERALVFYVDFLKEPALTSEVDQFLFEAFQRQLLEDYAIDIEAAAFVRGVYHADLQRFTQGIYGLLRETNPEQYAQEELRFLAEKLASREQHLRSCMEHASKAQGRQIVIFLDNIDQRPPEFQERIFGAAQSLADTWPGTVFVSLRPETFYRSKLRGALKAYQPRVFTIAPPRVDRVLAKRISYGRKRLASGEIGPVVSGFRIHSSTLDDYLRVVLDSFTSNRQLTEAIENLSGGNVRAALDFVSAFIGSGHVDTAKILKIVDESGSYRIPLHEFLRAILYGDHEHYDPVASPVANLFDISTDDGREHFLLPLILGFVTRSGEAGANKGYVPGNDVHRNAQDLGFSPMQTEFALVRAVDKDLLTLTFADDPADLRYRITTVGAYTAKKLTAQFSYFDAVIIDTPIVDPAARDRLRDARTIDDRLDRAELFRQYLDDQWAGLPRDALAFDWAPCSVDLARSIEEIRARAAVARRKRIQR